MAMMELQVKLDPIGFPMIWIERCAFYIHWLPVTKIQIEYFLSSPTNSMNEYDEAWYQNLCRNYTGRISPGQLKSGNYWRAFVTGMLPVEAKRFAIWCGRGGYDLLTVQEWMDAFRYLSQVQADPAYIEQVTAVEGLKERPRRLIRNLEGVLQNEASQLEGARSLADQMLMRLGVMEFVYVNEQRNTFAGLGQTHSSFFGGFITPSKGPQTLTNPAEGARMKHYGFRLICRS